jgi:transposase
VDTSSYDPEHKQSRLTEHSTKPRLQAYLLIKVDPAYTSQVCSECGYTDRKNRNGSDFKCKQCGHSMDADYNAAINIAAKGAVNSPNGS